MRLFALALVTLTVVPQAHAEIDERLVGWWEMTYCNGFGINECPVSQNLYLRADGGYRLATNWGEGEVVETGEWSTVACEDLVHFESCEEGPSFAIVLGELQPRESGWTHALHVTVNGQTFSSMDDIATDGLSKVWTYLGAVSNEGSSWSALKAEFR